MQKNKIDNFDNVIKNLLYNPYNYANKISVNKLVKILRKLSYHYYNTNENLVPDEIYDSLINVLEKRDPTNNYLREVGAPISKDKVKLPYYMASLGKIKPDTELLNKWKKKYSGPYVLSDKLDGVSGLFVKEKGKFKLYTRGNEKMGQDISYLIPYVIFNKALLDKIPNNVAIRGELIISKSNFKKISGKMKTVRNTVAGLVNSINYSTKIAKLTDFIGYSILYPKYKHEDQMKKLLSWKFPTVEHLVKNELNNDMLSKYLIHRRENGLYDIDGIVVVDSSKAYELPKKKPPYAFAFKTVLTDQIAEATVLDVEWNCSMYGYLKPRVRIDPIILRRVEITHATAFNAKFVKDNKLGAGSLIKLVRSGDVIPHIMEVLKPSAIGKAKFPDVPYYWNDTGVDIIVKDVHGACEDAIIIKKLTHFFKVMDVKYISNGIIKKLVDNGYNSLPKILKACASDLEYIYGLGDKLMTKIYINISNSFKKATLEKLMAASTLFGRGFGERRLKMILNVYPDILNNKWTKKQMIDNVKKIEGFNTVTATQFTNNFKDFKKYFKEIEGIVNISHLRKAKTKIKSKNIFNNMKIVFTGFRNKKLQEYIEKHGGLVTLTVSKNTSILVYSNTSSSKYKKAKELGVKLMTLNDFNNKYVN